MNIDLSQILSRQTRCVEERFGPLLDVMPDAILIVNRNGDIVFSNKQASLMFGYGEEACLAGLSIQILLPERYRAAHARGHKLYFEQPEKRRMCPGGDLYGIKKDGTEFSIDILLSPLETPDGNHALCAIRDISQQKLAEQRIQRLNRVYEVLSDLNSLTAQVTDEDKLFQGACRIAVETGKYSVAYVAMGDPPKVVASSNADANFVEKLQVSLDDSSSAPGGLFDRFWRRGEPIVVNNIQRELPFTAQVVSNLTETRALCALPLCVGGKTVGLFGLRAKESGFFDADEIQLLMRLAGKISFTLDHIDKISQLHYAAYYDQLTGLANATLFRDRLVEHVGMSHSRQNSFLVALVDMERFSNIHQTFGRCQSDSLLKQVARRLESCPVSATSVARMGADRFAVMVALRDEHDIARAVEHGILGCFDQPFQLGNVDFKVAAKIGVALYPDDCSDADTLITNAETALRRAKADGKRYLFYKHDMNERVAAQTMLENKLRRAVTNEEFVLHYQPKLSLSTRQIVGVEALIRWNDPDVGLIPPAQFIPLLEDTGLILEVGAWALRRAAADQATWVAHDLPAPRIAVNVSALQLHQGNFVEIVHSTVSEGSFPPGIDIEITESLIMQDVEENIGKLHAVRDLGINIAIDDFGTGYSSLAYLAKLPVKEVKIDRAFVNAMLEDANTLTLVSTIISLGHALGLEVVAEGVETDEQARMLRLLRCDKAQGFLFGKPMSFEAISALIGQKACA
jgi:diguanylate cyclase (GGDEF)-like protein/PAS domain S-box-containing protein